MGRKAQSTHVFALLYSDTRHAWHRLDAQLRHCLPRLLLAAALLAARPRSPVVCAKGQSRCLTNGPSGPRCSRHRLHGRALQAALTAAHQEPSRQGQGAHMVQAHCQKHAACMGNRHTSLLPVQSGVVVIAGQVVRVIVVQALHRASRSGAPSHATGRQHRQTRGRPQTSTFSASASSSARVMAAQVK